MRGKRLSADGSGQLGQGVVEFALMAPVMLILLAAVVEIGLVANDVLTLGTARARARARDQRWATAVLPTATPATTRLAWTRPSSRPCSASSSRADRA